jgi:hypothetical protein
MTTQGSATGSLSDSAVSSHSFALAWRGLAELVA